ncbi:MAG: hypothetical protein PHW18_10000 [Sulfuricurvum sp.]|uniref:HNH endonuclease n=1 Tax=Sulfuricurvum sp. TaxID=2025608 RepID=UPI0026322FA8|nr:hypothetical protein [Sulfuricurvum sp.]MDD2829893.1 hypothetical protein [Sulfuricurvum sp.]MDD4949537.1 hypothetical protein [Sulfuricurvum sp.]
MITIDAQYQNKLVEYFHKNDYDSIQILNDPSYNTMLQTTKDFLLNLSFEENGKIKPDVLFSEQSNNASTIETFFTSLINQFGNQSRDIFIMTPENIDCNHSLMNIDEQVKCIKKFIINKYSKMYQNMRSVHGKKLIQSSNLFVCPYCHRSYIGVIESQDGSRNITPDLDHFYPKSRYPFLAVTLSNLIPSCLFCNQRSKKNIDFYKSSIYPPQTIFDKIEFDFDPYTHKIYINNYADLITNTAYKTHLETFLIQEIYASHTEVLSTILEKNQKYRQSKIEDIAEYTIGLSTSDIKKLVFYEYEFMDKKKELLYKLKKDLYNSIVLK